MSLDPTRVGATSAPVERTWTATDSLLYAVAVGAGASDPASELAYTTENSADVGQRVLPTFGALLGAPGKELSRAAGEFESHKLVHAGVSLELHRPIPPAGSATTQGTLIGVDDKGSGALVTTEARSIDAVSGDEMFTVRSSVFIKGEGGFGSGATSAPQHTPPDRAPDREMSQTTSPGQALLYRLCGDRNPLHSDPEFAARAGFERPILHGQCTLGFTGRAVLQILCDGDDSRFHSIEARFLRPVFPGATLRTSVWVDHPGVATFTTSDGDGNVVMRGGCTYTA